MLHEEYLALISHKGRIHGDCLVAHVRENHPLLPCYLDTYSELDVIICQGSYIVDPNSL